MKRSLNSRSREFYARLISEKMDFIMDITLITASAATLGSLVGGGASIATTWITQRAQRTQSHAEWNLRERQAMYKQFITEASHLAVDALTHSLERPDQIMTLYGVLEHFSR